ncbi:unnamed protein product [Prorocentrum cordatum]|uniref:Uncharacterized protein n=1 Tax=Prorocentrum cordatum TaxID=2364126 RepID=A0ABN9WC67_9DINO|nr:unnamed protein product [Polarella glacialis]
MEEAVTGAVAEQEESLGQSSRRLLYQPQTLKYWTLDVYYTAKDEGGSVFTEDAMAEIRRFERSMFEFAGYEHFCHVDRDTETMECSIPNSVASIFNPSVQRVNGSDFDSTIEVAYDGQGECLSSASVADAVAALNQAGVSWWWDAGFDGSSASGMATRSQFRGGAPLGAASATAKLTDEMRAETQEMGSCTR